MDGYEVAWPALDRAFDEALRPVRARSSPLVVLFSGGVDSGLLAWELRGSASASLFTVGTPGAADLKQAAATVPLVGLPWEHRVLSDKDLAVLAGQTADELDVVEGPRRGIFLALAAAFAFAPGGTVLCGQGADELFLGYAHFRGLSASRAADRSLADLQALLQDDWPRTVRLAGKWHREVLAPYLDPGFLRAAAAVPTEWRIPGERAKEFFRQWAAHRGTPSALVERPKRAMQYGSGVDQWLRRRAPAPP